jgi:hypothetical protein
MVERRFSSLEEIAAEFDRLADDAAERAYGDGYAEGQCGGFIQAAAILRAAKLEQRGE